MHLILPCAASTQVPPSVLHSLRLPHLRQLLARLQAGPVQRDPPDEPAASMPALTPAEQVHARALGWPADGPWPTAAAATGQSGPQAWITPCHWQVGMDSVLMHEPLDLALSDEESQALMSAVQPWMAEDGLQLRWHDALHWHARGELLDGLAPASLARVSGGNIRPWLMDGRLPTALLRLQSEMQMLLYHHPVNEAREARRQPTVNSFWVHGAGRPAPASEPATVKVNTALAQAARRGDAQAWLAAWHGLDADVLAPLAKAPPAHLQLSLCSDHSAQTWTRSSTTWAQRLTRLWHRPDPVAVLQNLLPSPA